VVFGLPPQLFALLETDVADPGGQRERGDLDARVTDLGDEPALVLPVPALEQFLADSELHQTAPQDNGSNVGQIDRARLAPIVRLRRGWGRTAAAQHAVSSSHAHGKLWGRLCSIPRAHRPPDGIYQEFARGQP